MKTTAKTDFRLKDGRKFATGEDFSIFPADKNPDFRAVCIPKTGAAFLTTYEKLPTLFTDFHQISEDELETACMDGFCPSISGQDVEPDGHDEHGFPSWLIIMGFC